jgi:tripartite-type tricarboxylate transporter receptor subunit TctC
MKLARLSGAMSVAAIAALAVPPALAQAQDYPKGPVRMLVPFPPGSATDHAARVMAQQLQNALGKSFVIENKAGAQGTIAGNEVVRAAPDGQTLLFTSNTAIASNVPLMKKMPYDPARDFAPVAGIGETSLVLMVKPEFPAKDLKEFIAQVKQRPGKVSAGYGSTSSQISISMLNKLAGLDVLPVPYKGIPLAVNDVMGGQVDFTFVDLGNALAQAKGGKLRAIAVTAPTRSPLAPDWPTLAEVLPAYNITAWFVIAAPAGTPKDIVDKLHAATTRALGTAEVKEKLAGVGITPMPMTPAELQKFIVAEIAKWTRLTKEAGIEPE